MRKAKNPVKAVETTIRILDALHALGGAGVTAVAERTGTTKGTAHNHLTTLEEHGYVAREGDEFVLGLRFFESGIYVRDRKPIYEVGVPEVETLADETGEIANLLVEEHGYGIYLHRAAGEQALSLDTGVGSRVHLHNTALGKAILAHRPREEVEEILDARGLPSTTTNTITDRETLFATLNDVRERGVAFDREERADGVRCVAAPVTTNDGTVCGAVSVAGPTSRMKGSRLETDIPELVSRAANVVGINLTYH